jgi:bifunctional N-acetylglucosamine-1-phosphate-uridyltransferase/glucosamine-1-phosphate-acetyltransferase GlmU-like protein
VIVNYCDFGTYWNYEDFLKHTRKNNAKGVVVSYKGFHPHMLGSTNYAFMLDDKQLMLEIKEKEPFTNNRMNEYASNGTYYFQKGSYVKKYFQKLIDNDINLNGEYYVSLVYNLLVQDNLKVYIYEIQHMLQWGTPQDVCEYNSWSRYFNDIIKPRTKQKALGNSIALIPLAGHGSRFVKANYKNPKPLINVSGKPMIIQASKALPNSNQHIFITLKDHIKKYNLEKIIKKEYKNSKIVSLDKVTQGQAITCSLGLQNIDENHSLLIAPTDNSMIYDEERYQRLIKDESVDAVVFTFKNHISSQINPQMYGWVEIDANDNVTNVSVKVPISNDPYNDHAIVGTFYFQKVKYFNQALKQLLKKDIKVNNEYYVDSLINEFLDLNYKVKVFQVDHYICWGTPNDYETFVYWQSFFHKAPWHKYNLNLDPTVNKENINKLIEEYSNFKQRYI